MEGTESKSHSEQEDSQISQISLTETIEDYVVFHDNLHDILEEVEDDANFDEMTAENYDRKKSYLRKNLSKISRLHTVLFDQYVHLIDDVSKNSLYPMKKQHLDSSNSYSERKGSEPSASESSDSGSESTKNLQDSPVKDSALNVTEDNTPELLLQKISSLEDEVASLKQEIQSLTDENGELKLEIEENLTDVGLYMSETKLETDAMIKKLKDSKENAISQLKSAQKKKEKIWTESNKEIYDKIAEKCELVDELSTKLDNKNKQLNLMWADKRSYGRLIYQLKTKLNAVKFDNIRKLTDEVKLKVVELEREVDEQR